MRKVLIKKWIPMEFETDEDKMKQGHHIVDNTCCMEKDYLHKGDFHQWGIASYFEGKLCFSHTIGIIEMTDGTIEKVLPDHIKFMDTLPQIKL